MGLLGSTCESIAAWEASPLTACTHGYRHGPHPSKESQLAGTACWPMSGESVLPRPLSARTACVPCEKLSRRSENSPVGPALSPKIVGNCWCKNHYLLVPRLSRIRPHRRWRLTEQLLQPLPKQLQRPLNPLERPPKSLRRPPPIRWDPRSVWVPRNLSLYSKTTQERNKIFHGGMGRSPVAMTSAEASPRDETLPVG